MQYVAKDSPLFNKYNQNRHNYIAHFQVLDA